jgi:type VI secretion system secreted protein Hcp
MRPAGQSGGSVAAVDYFLKIEGIQGESLDAKHRGEIELESFSWGEEGTGSRARGAGAGAGKVQIEDLHVVMKANKASPLLLLACAAGQHHKQAALTARRAGKSQLDFLVYRLTDVRVSSYRTVGTVDAVPTDQVSLGFSRIEVELRSQKPDGSLDAPVKAGWDVKANRRV